MFVDWKRDYASVTHLHASQINELGNESITALNELFEALYNAKMLTNKTVSAVLAKLTIIKDLNQWAVPLLNDDNPIENHAVLFLILSDAPLREDSLQVKSVLMDVLSNPLSWAIFNERARVENAYCGDQEHPENNDPLDATCANEIIEGLMQTSHMDDKLKFFFDFFADFRNAPASQREMMELQDRLVFEEEPNSLADVLVRSSVDDTDLSRYLLVNDKDWFEHIKYPVAARIVSEDRHSMSRYDALMNEVCDAVNRAVKPKIKANFITPEKANVP